MGEGLEESKTMKKLPVETKRKVQKLLTDWGASMKTLAPVTPEGSIDMEKFPQMKEVKELISNLKEIGVKSNTQLMDSGFIAAGMLLRF